MKNKTRIAAVGDLHIKETSNGKYKQLFEQISKDADILLLCGDLTDHGTPKEADILKNELQACSIPILAVLGNHDYDTNKETQVKRILREGNIVLLDEETYEKNTIGFTGAKGFCGGYGPHMLAPFGEKIIKDFIQTSIIEEEVLELGLKNLQRIEKKIVALHYAPIAETNKGESPEIYPFLGTARLAEVIDRFDVYSVFHGHSHFGSPEGKTKKGIPVYNVAFPLMQKIFPKHPYRIIEV